MTSDTELCSSSSTISNNNINDATFKISVKILVSLIPSCRAPIILLLTSTDTKQLHFTRILYSSKVKVLKLFLYKCTPLMCEYVC